MSMVSKGESIFTMKRENSPPPSYSSTMLTKSHKTRTALLATFALLAFFFFLKSYPGHNGLSSTPYTRKFAGPGAPRVAKVSMITGDSNPIYERAIRSHRFHNEKHNYPMYVLRQDITEGYWNKPSYLLSIIVQELAKPPSERAEWLMWVDADLVLINPSLRLETFLPPGDYDHIRFLANKDHNGLNTGTFFIKVHEWSVRMLAKTIAFPQFRPDVNLHHSVDQEAMGHIFNESDFAPHVLYQPRIWYNTYEFHHAYEGRKGHLLVHFPGLEDDRWKHMSDWLDVVESTPNAWDVEFQDTDYPANVSNYWAALRDADTVLNEVEEEMHKKNDINDPVLRPAWDVLKRMTLFRADQPKAVQGGIDTLSKTLDDFKNGITQPSEEEEKGDQPSDGDGNEDDKKEEVKDDTEEEKAKVEAPPVEPPP